MPERSTLEEQATRIAFVGLAFDQLDVNATVAMIMAAPGTGPARYLVTPNVDHVVRLHRQHGLAGPVAAAYAQADWCVCDSRILAALCGMRGQSMTVAPGSDITRMLLDRLVADGDDRVIAVVGMEPNEFAALAVKYATLDLRHVPAPFGLAGNSDARSAICAILRQVDAAFILLAVGAPQQELIALEFSGLPGARGTSLCIGASLEFLIRPQTRAPRLLQTAGLEWAFRLVQNPRRLWRRYLYDGPAIFPIALSSTPALVGKRPSDAPDHVERGGERGETDIVDRKA